MKGDVKVILIESEVRNSVARTGCFIYAKEMQSGLIYLRNLSIHANPQIDSSLIWMLNIRYLLMIDVHFIDNHQTFLYAENSKILMTNVTVSNLTCADPKSKGCFAYLLKSKMSSCNSSFTNLRSLFESPIFLGLSSSVFIINVNFTSNFH